MTCLARALLCDLGLSRCTCLRLCLSLGRFGQQRGVLSVGHLVVRDLWRLEKGWMVAACHSPSVCVRCHSHSEL
jgi:hypothetical protein